VHFLKFYFNDSQFDCHWQFVQTLPNARLEWIEECGHVPHLEQPDKTAETIAAFISSDLKANTPTNRQTQPGPTYIIGAGFVGALAVAQALSMMPSN
jgi:hypothetical protein